MPGLCEVAMARRTEGGMTLLRYNCPNCGAGITGESCEFCGTVIYDFAAIQLGKPSYVKIMYENEIYMFRMIVDDLTIRNEGESVEVPDAHGALRLSVPLSYSMELSMNAHCVQMDTGALMTVVKRG